MSRFLATILGVVLFATSATTASGQATGPDEASIRKAVETTVKAINKDDLPTMLANIADDAIIDSRAAGGKVSKAKYAEVMAEVFKKGDLISAELRDVSVTMSDPARAMLLGTVYIQTKTSRGSGRVEWKLEKRDGRWLIVETNRK
jgi:ketosteroid isomerase-like protein